jgi:hypothetical protein
VEQQNCGEPLKLETSALGSFVFKLLGKLETFDFRRFWPAIKIGKFSWARQSRHPRQQLFGDKRFKDLFQTFCDPAGGFIQASMCPADGAWRIHTHARELLKTRLVTGLKRRESLPVKRAWIAQQFGMRSLTSLWSGFRSALECSLRR